MSEFPSSPALGPGSFPGSERDLRILGVPVADWTMTEALAWIESLMADPLPTTTSVFFANAHTLNLAFGDSAYRDVLKGAQRVFGDGTGVRWAARALYRVRLRGNVNGTDLVPELFRTRAGRGYSYYMLGATAEAIELAAAEAQRIFPGWELAGYHHGYLDEEGTVAAVRRINAAAPQLLLVGMGNPLQEQWLQANCDKLDVPVCLATGGLFDYWAGEIERAPVWMRRLGFEWLHLLLSQPRKLRRYILGNPLYLARVFRQRLQRDRKT